MKKHDRQHHDERCCNDTDQTADLHPPRRAAEEMAHFPVLQHVTGDAGNAADHCGDTEHSRHARLATHVE